MRVLQIAATIGLLTACSKAPARQEASEAAPPSESEPAAVVEPEAKPSEAKPSPLSEEAKPPPLSEEDKRLIAMDPADLTPELRRKRAYARRREAMQDPNSPLARTLGDLQKAYENGEIDLGGAGTPGASGMPTFTVDGKPPTSGQGPAGTRTGPAGARTPAK